MRELLEIYDLDGAVLGSQDRKEFYDQIREEYGKTGKITRKIKGIRVLVMNSEGRIYLQKRSNIKKENAGLYDKTVGGHIPEGESPAVTLVRECAEELGFPAVALSQEEFASAVRSTDLSVIGILRQVQVDQNFISVRKVEQGEFKQPYISYFYIGYYDGPMRFKDGESSGLETFSLRELQEELSKNPDKFTEDLRFMVEEFGAYLTPP